MNKKQQPPRYWIMDARANYDVDDAVVFSLCETLREARDEMDMYPPDAVIVDSTTYEVVG